MRRLLLAIVLLLPLTAALAIDPHDFDSAEQEQRYQDLVAELRCVVCQNQNLADSNADLAKDLRAEVLRLMREGLSDDEIKGYLSERYGDFVLYRPPLKPTTWALWFGPILLALAGMGAVVVVIRKRSTGREMLPDPDQEAMDRRLEEESR